jgi:hypothetical protein
MATIFSEVITLGDWLKGEQQGPPDHSRDQIILANAGGSAVTYVTGTVLGKLTSNGQFVPWTAGASDGSQTAAAILGPTTTVAASSTATAWAITRNARVSDTNLTYSGTPNNTQIAAALTSLAAAGIIARRTA